MRIALPIWEDRISPVFDVAAHVLIVDADRQTERSRQERRLTAGAPHERVETLLAWGVDVLICGAISRVIEQLLRARQVRVVSRICGDVDEVLAAFLADGLEAPRFRLPGCTSARRGGRRRRRRGATPGSPHDDFATFCEDVIISETEAADVRPGADGVGGGHDSTAAATGQVRAWVARVGDDLAGSLVLDHRGDVGHIHDISIAPRWREGPVPCRLIQHALGHCRRHGLLKVTLNTSSQPRRMLRLLQCLGFQIGRQHRHRGGESSTELYLDLYRRVDEERCVDEAGEWLLET
ncbi:MAG: NifB/NifX family molybdenum-iron cluster-binding protein [Planctomycetota bacterium]|nr:NifB/NifX family molybdenum-iron cluster-binding protein [Planctomycetota bacterium]